MINYSHVEVRGTGTVTIYLPPNAIRHIRVHAGQVWHLAGSWQTYDLLSIDWEQGRVELEGRSFWQSMIDHGKRAITTPWN